MLKIVHLCQYSNNKKQTIAMKPKILYKSLSARIVSRWIILAIDVCLVVASMILSFPLQSWISVSDFDKSLYVWMVAFSAVINIISFLAFRTYTGVLRFSSFVDVFRVFVSLTIGYGVLFVANVGWSLLGFGNTLPNGILFIAYIINFLLMTGLRIIVKMLHEAILFDKKLCVKVFIYGCWETSVNVAKTMRINRNNHYRVCGFISDEAWMVGKQTMGCKIYANDRTLLNTLHNKGVNTIIVSPEVIENSHFPEMMKQMLDAKINVLTMPPLSDRLTDGIIKDINIGDWLRREPVNVDLRQIATYVEGCRILIVGAAGCVGRELVCQLAALNPYKLILVDQAESPLYDVQLELSDKWKNVDTQTLVADVANYSRMESIFSKYLPQLVFHAAAYKNVSLLEDYPAEAIAVNVLGTKNIVDLSVMYGADKCVVVSSSCAVNPTHTMGYSKYLAEMYVQALSESMKQGTTQLFVTRFCDVYPYSNKCLMTMSEACHLILETGRWAENGGVYVFDDNRADDSQPTPHHMIRRCKKLLLDYDELNNQIEYLVDNVESHSSVAITNKLQRVISGTLEYSLLASC